MNRGLLQPPGVSARLRPKNQLTVPDVAVAAVGAKVGDRFVVTVEDGAIRLQPVPRSFAGALAGVYGDDWANELRRDRDTWPR
jgi:hypothetical protein